MIETQIKNTIKKYKLCNKKEKILVALSGGKDSTVTAYVLKKFGYNIEGIHINLGFGKFSEDCLKSVKKLCDELRIKLHIYNINMLKIFKKNTKKSKIFGATKSETVLMHKTDEDFVGKKKKLSNCAICGVVKKWVLNKQARKLRADKIATGHHLDDLAQTFLMNIFKGNPKLNANLSPILNIKDKKFIPRIKPLFFVNEKKIIKYSKLKKLLFIKQVCPYRGESYRVEMINFFKNFSDMDKKNLIKNFMKISKKIRFKEKMIYCEICGEPSRSRICKKCEIVER